MIGNLKKVLFFLILWFIFFNVFKREKNKDLLGELWGG